MTGQHVRTSKYVRIGDWIKTEISNGSIKPGDKLPSESELCDRFRVSRSAVRQAISSLVNDGWLESKKGIGTFCLLRQEERVSTLAFVCYFAGSYIFPRIVSGFERAVRQAGFHMTVNQSENDVEKERQILLRLREKGVAGIAITPVNFGTEAASGRHDGTNWELLRKLNATGTHVLCIDNAFGGGDLPSITLNDEAVGACAARHLVERGHTAVGIVSATNHRPFRLRRDGFLATLAAAGLKVPEERDIALQRIDEAEEVLAHLLGPGGPLSRDGVRPSALFCANDEIAIALYKAAKRCSVQIPEKLSVISVDNSEYATLPGIELTSIDHPSRFIGERAAQLLLDANAAPGVRYRSSIVIDPALIERSSVRSLIPGRP